MIHFFIGTKAQFIKMSPIMIEMKNRDLPFRYIDSGQHADLTKPLRNVFGINEPDISLRRNTGSITSIITAFKWYVGCIWKSIFNRQWLKNEVFPEGGLCLIHGDTLSTLLGMKMAFRAGLKIGHIEAGLRSYNILNPFPEEIIRILCMKKADILFAPSDEAATNLQNMGLSEKTIRINGNSILDALQLVDPQISTIQIPDKPFALATCHRLETITRKPRLKKVVALLNRVAEDMTVYFVIHQPTQKYLKKFNIAGLLHPQIRKIKMLNYNEFIALMKSARIILTDGGSIQEECSYLNKPCLILRNTTERSDGLGQNATLWKFNEDTAESFLSQKNIMMYEDFKNLPHPSAEIVDSLIRLKYID
jgi:UDP-N-acetylglucosamine 2-epimerase (non-hydrolysing)